VTSTTGRGSAADGVHQLYPPSSGPIFRADRAREGWIIMGREIMAYEFIEGETDCTKHSGCFQFGVSKCGQLSTTIG
jgi:hypothetical protein